MTLPLSQIPREHSENPRLFRASSPGGVLLRCLIAAAGMLLCAYAVILPALVPGSDQWASADDADDVTAAFIVVQLAVMTMPVVAGLVVLWLISKVERVHWRDYTGGAGARASITGLVTSTIVAAAITAAAAGAVVLSGLDADRGAAMNVAGDPILLVLVIGFFRAFMMQGIQEELWFRGFAFRGVAERPWLVLVATTMAFTALHLVSQGGQETALEHVLYLVLAFGMGFWAGVERWCTGSVWSAVGIHGGIHMGLTVVSIAGWSLGPAAWITIGLALSFAALVRLWISTPWDSGRN